MQRHTEVKELLQGHLTWSHGSGTQNSSRLAIELILSVTISKAKKDLSSVICFVFYDDNNSVSRQSHKINITFPNPSLHLRKATGLNSGQ